MPTDRRGELRDTFNLFDLHKTGYANPQEVRTCLLGLGLDLQSPVVFELATSLDRYIREGKLLSYDDFVQVIGSTFTEQMKSPDNISRLFHLFDPKGTGAITAKSLKEVCDEIGESISPEEIAEMIRHADADRDGCVNMDDFHNIMAQKPL